MKLQLLVIRIEDQTVNTKEGTGSKSGKAYKIVEQPAYALLIGSDGQADKYPTKISVNVEPNEKGDHVPYPNGDYTLGAQSFMVGDFKQLKIGRITLVSLVKDAAVEPPVRKAA